MKREKESTFEVGVPLRSMYTNIVFSSKEKKHKTNWQNEKKQCDDLSHPERSIDAHRKTA